MRTKIEIKNEASLCIIDIEGVIGAPEGEQFAQSSKSIATYERFSEELSKMQEQGIEEVIVNIRSTGGDVNDALLIYEALVALGVKITTRCYGYTASAATIIAQAASEGCRLIAPTSLYLIHQSLCSAEGNADELQAEIDMLRQTDRRIAEVYATRSGRQLEDIEALMSENGGRGRWLSPVECVAEGLVDAVESDGAAHGEQVSFAERAKKGVRALLRTIGISVGDDQSVPSADADINYAMPAMPHNMSDKSIIALEEGQSVASPSVLKPIEDPSPNQQHCDLRRSAYESDLQSMRNR
jgi:ATP-dependent protease ClpP protease subunit